MTWTAPDVTPANEPFVGDERAMLDGLLDYNRATLLSRCAGLNGDDLARRSIPPSTLSLLGLVRHLTDVERAWFRRRFAGMDLPSTYATDERPDAAFDDTDPDRAERDYRRLLDEQQLAREAVASLPLDHAYDHPTYGVMSLRWAYLHMIDEYAGHMAHAALLRECIDGRRED
jgi:uncharacterized damage-inducible protein DinB